ncbi:MAG: DUF2156 domain-containing protein [Deltaproteobacteria bacterium]
MFPRTRPLEKADKPLFDGLFGRFPPRISEYTFTNLFAWRKAYNFHLSRAGVSVLVISRKEEVWRVFDPVGPDEDKAAAVRACAAAPVPRLEFCRIPESTARLFAEDKAWRVRADRDNFDYVYRTKDLAGLKGKGYDGKRNFVKRFKEGAAYRYRPLTAGRVEECLSFEEEWCLAKDCQRSEGLRHEKEALEEILRNFEFLGVTGGMFEVGDKIEGVSLGEPLNADTFVVHVEKANGAFIGIYQALNQAFCEAAAAAYAYVNREQDLGVPGLRQAKESYHPCAMVKKYVMTLR